MRGPGERTPGDHNVATLHEAIAAVVPERECIVAAGVRRTWAEVTDRTRRLAAVLAGAGIGLRSDVADPQALAPWESPHDHVALYLHNGHEYLEGMLGAWKARAAGVNVNYRYVAAELRYVLADSRARAVIFHGAFAATLAEVLPELPAVVLLLQVDDGSGAGLLPGAVRYEDAVAAASPTAPDGPVTRRPLHPLHGRHDGHAQGHAVAPGRLPRLRPRCHRAARRDRRDSPGAGRAAHAALRPVHARGRPLERHIGVDLGRHRRRAGRSHPPRSRRRPGHVARERVSALQIVGDPFARPLLDELDAHDHDLSQLRFLLSGGAVLSAPVKERLVARLPGLRIVDVLGSSETGRQAVAGAESAFRPEGSTVVLSADRTRRLAPDEDEIGWLAQSGRVPLGYLGDEAKTRATFPTVEGVRHAVAGDRVRLLPDGTIELLGRDSVTINTGGEKVFAEEVEQVLTAHAAVADAVVAGRPSERWGSEIVAVLSARPGVTPPGDDELRAHCRTALAGYKVPKAFCWVDQVRALPRRQTRLRVGARGGDGHRRRRDGPDLSRRTRRWCSEPPAGPGASRRRAARPWSAAR